MSRGVFRGVLEVIVGAFSSLFAFISLVGRVLVGGRKDVFLHLGRKNLDFQYGNDLFWKLGPESETSARDLHFGGGDARKSTHT